MATRYNKRAYVFHGTVTLAALRLWLRSDLSNALPAVAMPINSVVGRDEESDPSS
ncbi:hypothetical protein GCM10010215_77750 [Streptomyces virginiae]|uniref:Transposase n=1 Tax=Streptomyces virginiae TaxID=1961 RepID=A0ABQ3NRV9_STRVG|nr:hypothetical protein GCM10010215_77750 [Streptomyces virginiae]GHI15517.1 hypothetical protein Scinn_49800 [Streptomyces virginiae]GLV96355.1 hypothetical protein Slala04_78080 [Streptomyces lavendulae subsp. lavendulae]